MLFNVVILATVTVVICFYSHNNLCREDVRQQALLGAGLLPTEGWLAMLGYLYPPGGEDSITPITHWICIDPDTQVWNHKQSMCTLHVHVKTLAASLIPHAGT